MKLSQTNKVFKQGFQPLSKGPHLATCIAIIDLGMESNRFNSSVSPKLMMCFEVHDEQVEFEGEMVPKLITAKVTISIHEKSTLRQWLDAWVGTSNDDFTQEWDIEDNCLGRPCIITVTHDQRRDGKGVYDRVTGVSAILPGMKTPRPRNRLTCFNFPGYDVDSLDQEEIEATLKEAAKLPELFQIRKKVQESETYKAYVRAYNGPLDSNS